MISTRNLKLLPDITKLKEVCQSIALFDAIIEPEWEFRYYSYNSVWGVDEHMASMRNGCGDSYFIFFNPQGAIIKGYVQASLMGQYAVKHDHPWPGVLDYVPEEFKDFLSEPAFLINEASFCIWRKSTDDLWNIGKIDFLKKDIDNLIYPVNDDPDGSSKLFFIIDGRPQTYQKWAERYYQVEVKLSIVESIYRHDPISTRLVTALNPSVQLEDLKDDIAEIGYPSLSTGSSVL